MNLRRSNNPPALSDRVWEYRSFPWFEDAWRDLRFALRSLAKVPSFAVIAILVIAVGIGANTAVFSVINTVLLKPLSYPDPQSLVFLMNTGPQGSSPLANVPKFNIWRQQTRIFDGVVAFDQAGAGLNLTGGNEPEQLQAVHVTADYFRVFGAPLLAGRTFTAAEDSPNGGHVAVLSYGLWKRRFGGKADMVGTNIQLDGQPYTVIGVIGPKFVTETPSDLWLPYQFDLNSRDMAHYFEVAARLKPGVTLQQANAELKLAVDQFRSTYPVGLGQKAGFGVAPLQEVMVGDTRLSLLVLLGAVSFVLLIACANVANLLLIRASVRQRELATRSALGAGRGHIIRQLLTESLTIALAGGLLGLIIGFIGVRLLLALSPGNIPRIGQDGSAVSLDLNVLLFAIGVSILTGVLFGLFPAISSARMSLVTALKESSSQAGVGFRTGKVRSLLVISEVALALILVVGSGLLIRTFIKLQAVDPGFDTHNVLTMAMSLSGERFQKTAGVAQLIRDGIERLETVPGISKAAAACCLPMEGGFGLPFDIVGRPKGNDPNTGGAGYLPIAWGYFDVFKVPILRGRSFSEHDDGSAPGVVIINQAMAKKYWPNGDPLNDRLVIGATMGPVFVEPPRQIIGVAGDMRANGLRRDPAPTMYIPLAQMPDKVTALNSRIAPLWWIIRSPQEPHPLAKPIAAALREASGGLPVAHVRTMDEIVINNTSRQRFNMLLLTIFGASALLVAAIGIYGLMGYSVQQRTQELGIRMALGAQASTIRNMVVRQGMVLAAIGIVIGVGGALWLTHFLKSFLFGVKALDPTAFIATLLVLIAVALAAVWFPARRATRVNPIKALRFE
ncbi:MAG TPA: ABC transporter permease [Terriglobales bacterium]|nr:ABC transporter permease [Terriglobales bacterium]